MDFCTDKRRLPAELAGLPCIKAEIKFRLGDGHRRPSLEGPGFDKDGNFYVCYARHNEGSFTSIMKIDNAGSISEFYRVTEGAAVGFALHQNGGMFFADIQRGKIRVINKDAQLLREISTVYNGNTLHPDCMEFDKNGDLWFTDLSGTFYEPTGGVYRLTAESGYECLECMISNLASPNGLLFSKDRSVFWVVETAANRLVRWQFAPDGSLMRNMMSPTEVFRNTGRPIFDTIRMDRSGNIYCGVMFGGRVLIFDKEGVPAANVLVPGFEDYKLVCTPNMAFVPGKKEAWLCASDEEGAYILSFPTIDFAQERSAGS